MSSLEQFPLRHIESIVLFVPDIEAAARWYASLLCSKVEHENPQYAYVRAAGTVIGFHPADEKCPGGVGGTTVYWDVSNLAGAVSLLVERGARLHRGPAETSFGAKVALLIDPFGCTIGLNEASRQSKGILLPIIRLAASGEAPAVLACVSGAFEKYIERIGKPPAPMLLDYPKLIQERSVWVAELAAEIEGVLVQFETPDGFYIDTVASSPRTRGTGIGRALLQFAEREATRRGYASVYLCTNSKMTENQVFYPSIGYVEYDRKSDAGYDRVFYRKRLA